MEAKLHLQRSYGKDVRSLEMGTAENKLHEEKSQTSESSGITFLLCVSVFGAICGSGLAYGYNISVLNNPEILLRDFFSSAKKRRTGYEFSEHALTWYWSSCVAALPLMAAFGGYGGSKCANKIGRRKTLLCNNILLILAGLMQGLSKPLGSYELFLLGRIVVGLQSGVSKAVCPMYLSEISPKKYRGGVGSVFQWFLTFGLFLGNVTGLRNVFGNSQRWPHLFTMLVVFAMIQLLVLTFCPESPKHLLIVEKNENAAMKALRKLRGDKFPIKEEISEMQKEFNDVKYTDEVPYSDYFRKPELRHPLMLGVMAALALRVSGVNAMTMYSQPIVNAALSNHMSVSNTETAKYIVCGVNVVRLLMTSFSVRLVDRIGRRRCELTGIAGLIISNTVLAFLLSDVEIGQQTCTGIPQTKNGQYAVIGFLFLQTMSLAMGVDCVAWLITPELFRTDTRSKAAFMVTTVNSVTNFLVALSFDLIRELICGWVFLIFTGLLLIPFIYFYLELPVLDGKSVNEIVAYFETRAKINRYTWIFKPYSYETEKLSEEYSRLRQYSSESSEDDSEI